LYSGDDSPADIEAAKTAMFTFGMHPDFSLFSLNAFHDPALSGHYPDHPFFRQIDITAEDLAMIHQPIDFIG
jgi:beta-glucosidase/6-phospho-beta-glucosidase/beta-galactosidase